MHQSNTSRPIYLPVSQERAWQKVWLKVCSGCLKDNILGHNLL